MSDHLIKYLPLLNVISKIRSKADRSTVLRIFAKDKEFVKAIKEIACNTVNGNIELTQPQKVKLRKYKQSLLKLAGKSGKTEVVQSGGGFLSLLIPIVSTVLGSMLNGSN